MKTTGLAIAVATALTVLAGPVAAQKGTTYVGRMLIDDGSGFAAGRVRPVGPTWYVDFRLGGDACVAGEVYSTGEVGFFLNRRMSPDKLCSETTPAQGGGEGRAYTLLIDDVDVCGRFPTAQPLDGGGCAFTTPADQPKSIEPGGIFKSKVSRTTVTFYFNVMEGIERQTYRLTTDTPADVVAAGEVRTVTHGGTVTLAAYQPWPSGYAPVKSFALPFRMVFERVALKR